MLYLQNRENRNAFNTRNDVLRSLMKTAKKKTSAFAQAEVESRFGDQRRSSLEQRRQIIVRVSRVINTKLRISLFQSAQ
jgi:hypothetical protein